MIIRKTTAEERQQVSEIFAIAFEMPMGDDSVGPDRSDVCRWGAFCDDDREMMSSLTVTDFQIRFDGHVCKMGGIGGVGTLPQYRRQGGIRGCFQAALPDMYDRGYDFSYLYPFSTNYYRKFGYESCVQKLQTTVHLGLLNPPAAEGDFRLVRAGSTMADAIRSIDAQWERDFNMMVVHDPDHYEWVGKADPARKQEFTYACFGRDGAPKAYTTFRKENQPDGRNLICSRFCFADREGFTGLMQVFKSLSADHMYAKFSMPAMPAMQYILPEWSLGAVQWAVQPAGMVRVVNVESVLRKARYLGSGAVKLKILDPQIAGNNCTFEVVFCEGSAVSVTRTEDAADAVLTIPTFSALIAGVCDFSDARNWFDGFEIQKENTHFGQVFYRKNMMIADYF